MKIKKISIYTSIFLFSLFVVITNQYPNIHAYWNTPLNYVYLGQASWFDPWDINIYVHAIYSGQHEDILLKNHYTSVSNFPIFIYPIYTTVGSLFKTVNQFLLFHILALFCGLLLCISYYYLLGIFIKKTKEKFLVLFIIFFGGGLGFFLYPTIQSPDMAMTSFTFLSAFQRPHEAIAILFYTVSQIFFFQWFVQNNSNKFFHYLLIIFFLNISLLIYPYFLLSFSIILSSFIFLLNKASLKFSDYKKLLIIILFCLPSEWVLYYQLQSNPTFHGVLQQSLSTPNIFLIMCGYGIFSIIFFYHLYTFKKIKNNSEILFLTVWILVSIFLAFSPFGFSRFFLRGLFFPLIIISFLTLKKLSYYKYLILVIIIFSALSSGVITYKRIVEVNNNNKWYYRSQEEFNSINFLHSLPKESSILSLYDFGNIIPAYTQTNVYFGHFIQTPDSVNKYQQARIFYSGQLSVSEAKNFLNENNITHVLYGKEEKSVGTSTSFSYSFLKPIMENPSITVFQVQQ